MLAASLDVELVCRTNLAQELDCKSHNSNAHKSGGFSRLPIWLRKTHRTLSKIQLELN